MTDKQKEWIDSASYQELLGRWRMSPIGDSMFQGETGDYYTSAMKRKKAEVGHDAVVGASKAIGW